MPSEKKTTIMVAQSILLPMLPNYVTFADGGQVDVAQLSRMQLDAIADAWKQALIEHAEHRRRLRKKS